MTSIIETPRIRLRGWTDADFEPWSRLFADPIVMEFFPQTYESEESIPQAKRAREEFERNGYGWFIAEVKDRFPFAGIIALRKVPFEAHFTPAYEIGWLFFPQAWGRGYATEAARAALDYAFGTLGWHEVVAITSTLNLRSQRVMQRLGMTHDVREDFDHPKLPMGHPLQRHVLYRIQKDDS